MAAGAALPDATGIALAEEPAAAEVEAAADGAVLAAELAAEEEEAFALDVGAAFAVGFGVAACAIAPTETATDRRKARPTAP